MCILKATLSYFATDFNSSISHFFLNQNEIKTIDITNKRAVHVWGDLSIYHLSIDRSIVLRSNRICLYLAFNENWSVYISAVAKFIWNITPINMEAFVDTLTLININSNQRYIMSASTRDAFYSRNKCFLLIYCLILL